MNEFWDERYQVDEYVYGKEPNDYFKYHLDQLKPGRILLPGEGEGRNAVYAASKGWEVFAFDTSSEGRKKAMSLAKENKVHIEYVLAPYLGYNYAENYFDAVGLFFTHQPSEMRKQFHQLVRKALKPAGHIIMEGFHKEQIHRNTGGPKNFDFLFGEEEIREDFKGFEVLELKILGRELQEGLFHRGRAEVLQLFARKL